MQRAGTVQSRLSKCSTRTVRLELRVLHQISGLALGNDLPGIIDMVPPENLGVFRLKQFVGGEKRFNLLQPCLAQIVKRVHVVESWIADWHRQHFEIRPLFVMHIETAKWAGFNHAAGERRLLHQDENIQVIAIFTQRVRNPSIVAWVMHRGVEHPIELESSQFLVVLVLVSASPWNLNKSKDTAAPGASHPQALPCIVRTLSRTGCNSELAMSSSLNRYQ